MQTFRSPLPQSLSWICSTFTGRETKSVILNSFQDLSFRKAYLTLALSWICSTLTGEGRLTGRGTKSVILNLFQDLSFPQSIPHPPPLLLRRGYSSLYKSRRLKVFESFLSIIVRSTVTDYSLFTLLSLFTHLFAPSPVLRTPSPNREREI